MLEQFVRCENCGKGHVIHNRGEKTNLKFNFICRCSNKISGAYNGNWEIKGAKIDERKEDEPAFIHEPEY